VRPLARMCALMDAEVLLVGERLVAHVALEDLLASVATLVRRQASHGRQHRAAQIAQVLRRGLVRESVLVLHVRLQQSLIHELLRAEGARVPGLGVPRDRTAGLLIRVMRHQMHRQILLVLVTLAAVLATVEILVGMRALMIQILDLVEETLAARLAFEAIISRVPPMMALQVGLLVGAVLAEVAREHLQSRVYQLVAGYVHRAAECLVALVAAEGPIDVVQVLQVLHELPRVTEVGSAHHALVHGARLASPLPEIRRTR